ncbi:MAG TPA: hypothetical protein VLA43_01680 [Longimicrobiales bacterium]|nr:hypothetical protein [Longimicrobiales bacterium]
MYINCMFCQKDLGRNQVVEHFPVGRRLVFDAGRGRLWVVCQKCERWNLTPLEERWEAVEECERLFRETRLRTQSENMGLARHREGLVLVRVGEPLREEFAAWRYGDQFGRRRRKMILTTTGIVVVGGILVSGALAAGIISGTVLGQSGNFVNAYRNGRTLTQLRTPDGDVLKMKRPDLLKTRLLETVDDQGWGIQVKKGKRTETFTGGDARRVAGLVLPHINAGGGKPQIVQDAVTRIEEAGHPEEFLRRASAWRQTGFLGDPTGMVSKLDKPTRLALEMALHEETERRALEGELWLLEQRWKEAEEIAAIADGLLLPEDTDDFLERHRTAGEPGDGRESP